MKQLNGNKLICTSCLKTIRKNSRTLTTTIYHIEQNKTNRLVAFPDELLCYKCSIKKYKNWLAEHHIEVDRSFKEAFWIDQYPEHTEFIKTRMSGKGSLQHYLNTNRSHQDYINKNHKLSVGVETLRSNGKTDEEIQFIKDSHAKNSLNTEETFIKKYGYTIGIEKWKQRLDKARRSSKRSLQYWLERYPKDQAELLLKEHQTRNRAWFIKNFGQKEGEKRYTECLVKKLSRFTGVSHAQLIFEQTLLKEFENDKNIKTHSDHWFISLNKEERQLLGQQCIFPDLLFKSQKLIIEFFGDFWHCHPELFLDDNKIHPIINKTVKEIRNTDKLKIEILKKRGYNCLVIWETDWNSSPQLQILKIKNLLTTLL